MSSSKPPLTSPPALAAPFEAWCAHQRQMGRLRREASITVYRAMWLALAEWCAAQDPGLPLQAMDASQLQRYLDSRQGMAGPGQALTPRYRLRLLSLVRWVQTHDLACKDPLAVAIAPSHPLHRHRSAAALAWSAAHLAAQPGLANAVADAPDSLGAEAAEALIAWLQGGLPSGQAPAPAPCRWQTARDHAALALQLGAGIGPGDLRALRLADVLPAGDPAGLVSSVDLADPAVPADPGSSATPPSGTGWQLTVPGNGNAPAYRARVAAWAAPLLQHWLAQRLGQQLSGQWLFPSTRSGKPWGKVAQYESVRRCLAEAGLASAPGGSFRLRHSFALRQLVHGHDADSVAAWLGVSDPAVMLRYRQALGAALIDHAAHGAHQAQGSPPASAIASATAGDANPAPPWPI